MILLDTHTLIWHSTGNSSLGPSARELIEKAFQEDCLAVSAVSFWEVAMLLEKGRLKLEFPAGGWRQDLLGAGLQEIGLDGPMAIGAAQLEGFHGDPADRFIVMTAIARGAKLITADAKILAWPGDLSRFDARC